MKIKIEKKNTVQKNKTENEFHLMTRNDRNDKNDQITKDKK